jgi:hypothetical protein
MSVQHANNKNKLVDFARCGVWLKRIGWEMMLCIIGMFFY